MLRYLFLICLLLAVNSSFGFAGKPVVRQKKVGLKTDSTIVNVRHFDTGHVAAYNRQVEFQYHEGESGPSVWTRFWRWFWHLFSRAPKARITPFSDYFFLFLKYFFVLAGIGALVFLIMKLAGIDMASLFRRKPKSGGLQYSELIENIYEIDFDAEIEKAIAGHNYRLAVRLLYLRSLKQLNDAGLIEWQINKTNSVYIYEIADAGQRDDFKKLTYQFEYVWYGEFLIDQQSFQQINQLFQQFKKAVA